MGAAANAVIIAIPVGCGLSAHIDLMSARIKNLRGDAYDGTGAVRQLARGDLRPDEEQKHHGSQSEPFGNRPHAFMILLPIKST